MRTVTTRQADERKARIATLSRQERQVLDLACEGLSDRLIARRMGLCSRTVSGYMTRVLLKLNVNTRIEAEEYVLAPIVEREWVDEYERRLALRDARRAEVAGQAGHSGHRQRRVLFHKHSPGFRDAAALAAGQKQRFV